MRLLAIFIGFNILAVVLIFLFVPETAGVVVRKEDGHLNYMKLEDLNYIFSESTSKHVSYQVGQMLPYAVKMVRWWMCGWFLNDVHAPVKPKEMWVWADRSRNVADAHSTGTQMEHIKEANVSQRSSAHSISLD